MTGHLGKRSTGMNPLRGQNNVQGANDAGRHAGVLSRLPEWVDDPEVRKTSTRRPGASSCRPRPVMNLNVMMKAVGKQTSAGCSSWARTSSSPSPTWGTGGGGAQRQRASSWWFRSIVHERELRATPTSSCRPSCLRREGRGRSPIPTGGCSGCARRSSRRVHARADWQILLELMRRAGLRVRTGTMRSPPRRSTTRSRSTDAEVRRHLPPAHRPRDRGGLQVGPAVARAPMPDHPRARPSCTRSGVLRGKGLFQPVEFRPPGRAGRSRSIGLVLSTGRTLYHYNAATQTRRSESGLSTRSSRKAFVEVHRRDAKQARHRRTASWSMLRDARRAQGPAAGR